MDGIHFDVVKRGLNHFNERFVKDGQKPINVKIPAWGWALFIGTILGYLILSEAIRYTYMNVVATLAMIETPSATAIVATAPEEPQYSDTPLVDPDHKASIEQELLLVKTKPITAKLRTTIRHLRARAGFWSRFRGAHVLFTYSVIFHALSGLLVAVFPKYLVFRLLIHIMVSVILTRLAVNWTHHVISEPSEKRWYRRFIPGNVAKKVLLPTAVAAAAEQACLLVPVLIAQELKLKEYFDPKSGNPRKNAMLMSGSFAALFTSVVLILFVLLPVKVAIVRVYSSLLAEEEEAIVPFDRTYGGKVVPAIVGGSGKLEMRDAWTTFDWNARVRLVKVYLKTIAMQFALFVGFTLVMFMNVYLVVGKKQIKDISTLYRANNGVELRV